MSEYWGEIPVAPEPESGIAAIEREQITKPKSMEVEGPRLHQPSSRHFPPSSQQLPASLFAIDPITKHTILLVAHAKKLKQLIHSAQAMIESVKSSDAADSLTFPAVPPMPEYSGPPPSVTCQNYKFPCPFEVNDSDFQNGIGKSPPEIDEISCRRLLRKSTAALCAHAGFETCSESILETFTDIGHEYFLQLTKLLRRAIDSEAQNCRNGFPDCIQQVFHEVGIGSVTKIHEFYQNRVLNYQKHMIKNCNDLVEEYENVKKMTKPETKAVEMTIKEELVPDINFPESDDLDEAQHQEQLLALQGLGFDAEQEDSSSLQHDDVLQQVKSDTNDQSFDNISMAPEACTPSLDADLDDFAHGGPPSLSDIMSPPQRSMNKAKKLKKR